MFVTGVKVGWLYELQSVSSCVDDFAESSGSLSPDELLEFCEYHFDWIQVGTAGWQVDDLGAC